MSFKKHNLKSVSLTISLLCSKITAIQLFQKFSESSNLEMLFQDAFYKDLKQTKDQNKYSTPFLDQAMDETNVFEAGAILSSFDGKYTNKGSGNNKSKKKNKLKKRDKKTHKRENSKKTYINMYAPMTDIEVIDKLFDSQPDMSDPAKTRMSKLLHLGMLEKAKYLGLPDQVREQIQTYTERLIMQSSSFGPLPDRALNCQDNNCAIPLTFEGIWGYGCWCNFGENLTKGQGVPVNSMDWACERMQQCLRCSKLDSINAGEELCDPFTQTYNSLNGINLESIALSAGCLIKNPGNACATHICTCESQLINDILELIWISYTYEPEYRHESNPSGGDFDIENTCVSTGGMDLDCCGHYPFRYTFDLNEKECCKNTQEIFSPFDSICCENSGVQKIYDGGCDLL